MNFPRGHVIAADATVLGAALSVALITGMAVGLMLAGIGLACGIAVAFGLTHLLEKFFTRSNPPIR